MEHKIDESHQVINQLKSYLITRLKLLKYQAAAKGTAVVAGIVAEMAVIICYLLTFLFASVTLGFFLASFLESGWAGFGCLALIYLVIAVAIIIFKKRFERPIINAFIHKIIK